MSTAEASRWPRIVKDPQAFGRAPNLSDPAATRERFDWGDARGWLDGLPGGAGLNIAFEAVDRHLIHGRGARTALRWIGKSGERRDLSYADLAAASSRFAHALASLGLGAGDGVFVLMGRVPELHAAMLGALKARAVVTPLFSAFGPEPIVTRCEMGDARLIVTTPELYQRKLRALRGRLPRLSHVVLVGDAPPALLDDPGVHRWATLVDAQPGSWTIPPTPPDSPSLLHFTSGTTGRPKGAQHVHEAVVAHAMTGRYALDLHDDDVYWCTADPGWVTGTSYGIVAPLVCGVTSLVVEAEFDAASWYDVLERERVSVWYTAPTAIRMMMRLGTGPLAGRDLSALRFMASVGEPLNPEAVVWGQQAFGLPFHDNWWQTETGGIMIANVPALDIKPGSMGQPLPGVTAAIVQRGADGHVHPVGAGIDGELALKTPWPSMMRGYLNEPARYDKCFDGGWYLSGDLARRDEDGYYWFVGRADDVIKSAGHLIGPFEVESALMEHPAVAEAAVIGKPDALAGETVKAFVVLRDGFAADTSLQAQLLAHARTRLGPAVAPKEIAVVASLPHTRSGKVMRRLLRARELGLPEGDTSTLEGT